MAKKRGKFMRRAAVLLLTIIVGIGASLLILLEPSIPVSGMPDMDKSILDAVATPINIYDGNGKALEPGYSLGGRHFADAAYLPVYIKNAFIAIEDRRFYSHKGLDYKRIAGAAVKDLTKMSFKEGASSITQQLAKNTHLSSEKKLTRKVAEARIAREIERRYSKEEILNLYINCVYYGSGAYGLEEAARTFFSKSAKNLALDEAAMLAAVINSPSRYSPLTNYDKAAGRRNIVLKAMKEQGYISEAEYAEAAARETKIKYSDAVRSGRSYLCEVIAEAKSLRLNEDISGCSIYTYLNTSDQKALSGEVYSCALTADGAECSALMIDKKNFGITAYASTTGLPLSEIRRQPASAIKPLAVYAPAFEEKLLTLATPILDEPVSFGGYSPKNINNKYYGWVDAKTCIADSLNIPAVKTMETLGVEKSKDYLKKAGITTDYKDGLALALGGMTYGVTLSELTGGYALLAGGGVYQKPAFVREIRDSSGKTVYKRAATKNRVFSESTAYLTTVGLRAAVKNGTAKALKNLPFEVAAKTGTNGNETGNTDIYCISYTSRNALGVWIGSKDSNSTMPRNVKGGNYAAKLNKNILEKKYGTGYPENFAMPVGVRPYTVSLSAQKDKLRTEQTNSGIFDADAYTEYFSAENPPDSIVPFGDADTRREEPEIAESKTLLDKFISFFRKRFGGRTDTKAIQP